MAIHGTLGAVTGSLQIGTSGAAVTTVLDEDNMSTNSATALATQQSIKAYVDASTPSALGDIGNVNTTDVTKAAGHVLIWDASNTRWENAAIAGTSNEIGVTLGDGSVQIGMPDDVTVAGDLTIGADADGTDRKITFGHSTLKTSIGIDDSADLFAINTDVNFETGNDLEINSSGDVTIGNGDLYLGGHLYGPTNGQLTLRADTNVRVLLDDDNDGTAYFRILDGGENIRFEVNESGDVQLDGDLTVSGGSIGKDGTAAITIDSSENVQIANGRLKGPTDTTFNIDSDGDIEFQVDRDGDGSNKFAFKSGTGVEVANIDESGNLQMDGDLTVSGGDIKDTAGNTMLSFDGSGNIDDLATITQDVVIGGGIPTLTLGDGGDEDIKLKFNGDTNDYHMGYDATDDVLKFGIDSTLGANGKTALLITSGSYVAAPQGSKWAPTVCVNEDMAGGISDNALWTKIAAAPAFNGNFASRTAVFMITFQPYGIASQEHDSTFIVKVRYIRDAANTPDTDVTDIFVESLNAGIRSNVDIQEDHFVLTYDGNNGAELWAQAGALEHQYSLIYCTIMHGGQSRDHYQNEYDGNYDGWQIQSGMLGQASYDSMGTDVVGVRMKKHYKEVMVDDSLLVSGSITAAGAITSSGDIQTSGEITGGKLIADGDTSAGDAAAIGYTGTEGIIITGQGSTNDVTIKNDADAEVIGIPTGTTNVEIAGDLLVDGHARFLKGFKYNNAVRVTPSNSGANNGSWVKILTTPTLSGNSAIAVDGVFLLTMGGGGVSNLYGSSEHYILHAQITHDDTSPYYFSENGPHISVEAVGGVASPNFVPSTDLKMTHDSADSKVVEVWVQEHTGNADITLTWLGGKDNHVDGGYDGTNDPYNWSICTDQSWGAFSSRGTDHTGTWSYLHVGQSITGGHSTHTQITNDAGGYIELKSNNATYGVIIRDYNSDDWGQISTNDGYLELGYNTAGGPVYITDDDYVGMGKSSPGARLEIEAVSQANNAGIPSLIVNGTTSGTETAGIVKILNTDTSIEAADVTLRIQHADSSTSGGQYWIGFYDNSTLVGGIDAEVLYDTFTGAHPTIIEGDSLDNTIQGMILRSTGEIYHRTAGISNAWCKTEPSSIAKDKAVVGVYNKPSAWGATRSDGTVVNPTPSGVQYHMYNAIGEGQILVTDEGGNIEAGDYICSSNRLGHGMLQDDDILHNYTVAKATEGINFSSIEIDESLGFKSVLIACTYHAG